MKKPSGFITLVICLLLGSSLFITGAIFAFHKTNTSQKRSEANVGDPNVSDLFSEALSPTQQLQKKFNTYNFIVDHDTDASAISIYSEDQTQKFAKMREDGERQSLTLEEILFLMNDSIKIYYQYDEVVLTNAYKYEVFEHYDGCPDSATVTTYHGDFSEFSINDAAKQHAQIVEDVYKIFFFRCYMYDTWLTRATESYVSATETNGLRGYFQLACREYASQDPLPDSTTALFVKYLNEEKLGSYNNYLDMLEASWSVTTQGITTSYEQPLIVFVPFGIQVRHPDGSRDAYYIGDLIDSSETNRDFVSTNIEVIYKHIFNQNIATNSQSGKYHNTLMFSEYKTKWPF